MQKNSLNKVILVGRLGGKPEGRYTQKGRSVVTFSIATNESWEGDNHATIDHTEWHTIVAWEKLAEFANEYLYKGQLVSIEGVLRTRTWDDKEYPIKRKSTEILCSNILPLEWKKKDNNEKSP